MSNIKQLMTRLIADYKTEDNSATKLSKLLNGTIAEIEIALNNRESTDTQLYELLTITINKIKKRYKNLKKNNDINLNKLEQFIKEAETIKTTLNFESNRQHAIPPEICEKIWSCLDRVTLSKMALTSRFFKVVVEDYYQSRRGQKIGDWGSTRYKIKIHLSRLCQLFSNDKICYVNNQNLLCFQDIQSGAVLPTAINVPEHTFYHIYGTDLIATFYQGQFRAYKININGHSVFAELLPAKGVAHLTNVVGNLGLPFVQLPNAQLITVGIKQANGEIKNTNQLYIHDFEIGESFKFPYLLHHTQIKSIIPWVINGNTYIISIDVCGVMGIWDAKTRHLLTELKVQTMLGDSKSYKAVNAIGLDNYQLIVFCVSAFEDMMVYKAITFNIKTHQNNELSIKFVDHANYFLTDVIKSNSGINILFTNSEQPEKITIIRFSKLELFHKPQLSYTISISTHTKHCTIS